MKKPEFNNGFVTAIALFLEHKNESKEGRLDLRLYVATDHLYEMEFPARLPPTLKKRIVNWRSNCFGHRLDSLPDKAIVDALFTEAEDILAKIDELIFKTKKVKMSYR